MASSITQKMFFPETQRRGLNEFPGADERAAEIRAGKRKNRLALQRMADETILEKQERDAEAATVLEQFKQQEETSRLQDKLESEKGLLGAHERYYNAMAGKADRSPNEKERSLSDIQKLRENTKKHFMLNYGIDEIDGQLMPPAEGYTKEQMLEMQRKAEESGLVLYPTAMDESGERYTLRGIEPVYDTENPENPESTEGSSEQATSLADELEELRRQAVGDTNPEVTTNNSSKGLQALTESDNVPFEKTRLASLLGKTPQALAYKGYRGAYRGLNKYGIQPVKRWLMSPTDEE